MKQQYYLGIISVLLIFIWWQHSCNKPAPCPPVPEIVKIDTVWKAVRDTTYITRPGVVKTVPGKLDTVWITEFEYKKVDTGAILKDYFATRIYHDSLKLKGDSSGLVYGTIYVTDTIHRNELQAHGWTVNLKLPVIEKTVQLPVKPSNAFYGGGMLQGNRFMPVNGGGPVLFYRTKGDKLYGAGVVFVVKSQPVYQAMGAIKL